MERYREIEKSIIKKYRKQIWAKFVKAVKEYELILPNDSIAVCISGGKDSMLLAKCLEELKRHGQFKFDVKYIVMDPGYNQENLAKIKENLSILNIDAIVFESDIFKVSTKLNKENPCYMCARMRRGYLYNEAKELGCNKIALGHHMDDVIETILMNMIYNGRYGSMPPKLHSDNFLGMELIRPLYLIREKDINSWAKSNKLSFIDCACSITEKKLGSRLLVKSLIKDMEKLNPDASLCIFKSSNNINLNTVLGYYKDNQYKSFLDEYSDK